MADEKVLSNDSCLKGSTHASEATWPADPVATVIHASSSLKLLAESLDEKHDYGQANMLFLLADQLASAAERLDEEDWEPTRFFN